MIKFILSPQNLNDLGVECEIIQINKNNYLNHIPLIENGISYFNEEIEWSNMFDLEIAIDRLNRGMFMYIGIVNNDVFGYVWFNGGFLFNLFVRNKLLVKLHSGRDLLSNVIRKYEFDKNIYCEVDDWNIKSHKLFYGLGFRLL